MGMLSHQFFERRGGIAAKILTTVENVEPAAMLAEHAAQFIDPQCLCRAQLFERLRSEQSDVK